MLRRDGQWLGIHEISPVRVKGQWWEVFERYWKGYSYYRTLMRNSVLEVTPTGQHGQMTTRSGWNDSKAVAMPLQKHFLGGYTINMPSLNCYRWQHIVSSFSISFVVPLHLMLGQLTVYCVDRPIVIYVMNWLSVIAIWYFPVVTT